MKKVLLLIVLFCLTQTLYAQLITAQGIVVDNLGPLSAVNIVEQGTTNGTLSQLDGRFSISVHTGSILVFSYHGYKTKTVNASPNMGFITLEFDNMKSTNTDTTKDRRRKRK